MTHEREFLAYEKLIFLQDPYNGFTCESHRLKKNIESLSILRPLPNSFINNSLWSYGFSGNRQIRGF
jgi:hypothetical protein